MSEHEKDRSAEALSVDDPKILLTEADAVECARLILDMTEREEMRMENRDRCNVAVVHGPLLQAIQSMGARLRGQGQQAGRSPDPTG